jgi:hypothetical protein
MGLLAVKRLRTIACRAALVLQIDSTDGPGGLAGEIHATIAHPFAVVAAELKESSHWCEILLLHLDTKECEVSPDGSVVTVGVVSRYDQPASSAYRVSFGYTRVADTPSSLQVRLDADKGPLGTSDYRIVFEAAPAAEGQTSIHMSYSYSYGVMATLAMQAYLATFGRNKVGFTVVGNEADGQPRYIGGMRGVVERNTMRYYLAVEAFLDALSASPRARQDASMRNWYSAIERYPRQLHEMERENYLAMKRLEFASTIGPASITTRGP